MLIFVTIFKYVCSTSILNQYLSVWMGTVSQKYVRRFSRRHGPVCIQQQLRAFIYKPLLPQLLTSKQSALFRTVAPNGWLLCFSVVTNGEKILSTRQSPNNINVINGIRTISTFWVVLGHTVAMVLGFFGKR